LLTKDATHFSFTFCLDIIYSLAAPHLYACLATIPVNISNVRSDLAVRDVAKCDSKLNHEFQETIKTREKTLKVHAFNQK